MNIPCGTVVTTNLVVVYGLSAKSEECVALVQRILREAGVEASDPADRKTLTSLRLAEEFVMEEVTA